MTVCLVKKGGLSIFKGEQEAFDKLALTYLDLDASKTHMETSQPAGILIK